MVCEGFIFLKKKKKNIVPYTKNKMNESPKRKLTNKQQRKRGKNKTINGHFLSG